MSLSERLHRAAADLGPRARIDEPLGPLTTYRVGGCAAIFVAPATRTELDEAAAVIARHELPLLVVGRGSNLLVADRGFDGVAMSLSALADGIEINGVEVYSGSAVALPVLARKTAAAGLTGFEWAVGVPGSIGGAVRMNAGGHGSDIAACLVQAEIFDVTELKCRWRPASTLGLRFRGSGLNDHEIVLTAHLQLAAGDIERSEHEIAEIVRWRRENQPGGQNAGSVFVNPIPGELSAGELIDRVGLRGFRIGGAFVSDKHANFIQAGEGATAADVKAVIEAVRERVARETGFELRSEVRLVGFTEIAAGRSEGGRHG
ncbi:MAG TPA: UDP-N-acetylmuramate dehydrogenase [Ilumatobacteraceae bacterium]|nr:UDP-N-acetylmuramate dehydrogenase [Ilumatobacteraceae bacterium]